jgi:transcriptional regulator with XRE-family HTH domain
MTIPFERLRRKWMNDPKFVAEYESLGPAMDLAMTLAEARRKAGLTQTELADRMKTSQAEVARIESGRGGPKWATIERYASALGRRPVVKLEEYEEIPVELLARSSSPVRRTKAAPRKQITAKTASRKRQRRGTSTGLRKLRG